MSDNETLEDAVVIERVVAAPIDLVWQLWTEAEHFRNWYGPQGFTIPVAEMDVRIGGRRLICMASPDGQMKMWFTGEYREVSPTTRLVYTESMADEQGNILSPAAMGMPPGTPETTEITVLLAALGEKTKMTMTHAGVPAGSPGAMGWQQAFAKLADYVGMLRGD
ncbi:MAG: SRPBCC domain-containing protein [Ardenticatenales bacterium]|nr:SRPBCC domain-containing protein [Ardenticatenales bacterium]